MILKLNMVSALAAVLFFFLPWTSIECSGRQMATQTGFQVLSGGATTIEKIDSEQLEVKSRKDRSLAWSYLAVVAFLCAVAAVVSAFAAFLRSPRHLYGVPGMLCACALVCLIAQAAMGFPVKREVVRGMAEKNPDPGPGGENELGHALAGEIAQMIQVRPLPGFYAELVALGIPTLILLNGVLDRLRAASEKRA